MIPRNLERFGLPLHESDSLGGFLSGPVRDGITTIQYEGGPLDLLVADRGKPVTVVVFHAALHDRTRSLPVLAGLGVLTDVDANIISLADPSLSRFDLQLAWFAGNRHQDLQRDLPLVIRHCLDSMSVPSVPVFFGASGGGFAALYYATHFPGSLAVPVNPQTDLAMYTPGPVMAYADAAFGTDLASAGVVTDLVSYYRDMEPQVTVGYVQNIRDSHHRDRHFGPFMRGSGLKDQLILLGGDWGKGHKAPPAAYLAGLLGNIAASEGHWSHALEGAGGIVSPTIQHVKTLLA